MRDFQNMRNLLAGMVEPQTGGMVRIKTIGVFRHDRHPANTVGATRVNIVTVVREYTKGRIET